MSSTYVLCPNTRCRNPDTGGRSWRWSNKGPSHCKFCNAKFRIQQDTPRGKSPRKRDGDDGSKGSGKGKGRGGSRKSHSDSSRADADTDAVVKPHILEEQLKLYVQSDPSLPVAVDFGTLFPKREKTAAETRKEAVDQAERAQTQFNHQEKVLDEMRTSLGRKAQELLDYQLQVQEQEVKAGEAKQLYLEARHFRDSLDASIPTDSHPPSPITGELNQYLAEQLQGIQIPAALASDIASGINSIVQKVRVPPPPSAPPLPPPSMPPSELVRARVQREQLEAALERARKEEQDRIQEEETRASLANEAQAQARRNAEAAGHPAASHAGLASQGDQVDSENAHMRVPVDKREGGDTPEGENPPARRRATERSRADGQSAAADHITIATAAAQSIISTAPGRDPGDRNRDRSGSRTPKGSSSTRGKQPG